MTDQYLTESAGLTNLRSMWQQLAEKPESGKETRPLESLRRRPQRGALQWDVLYPSAANFENAAYSSLSKQSDAEHGPRNIALIQNYTTHNTADANKSKESKELNTLLLEDLEGGVNRIAFQGETPDSTTSGLERILHEIRTSPDAGPSYGEFLGGVHCNLVTFEVPATALLSFLQSNPGSSAKDFPTVSAVLGFSDIQKLKEYSTLLGDLPWTLRIADVHNFGADAVTELACMLSTLAEIARQPDGKRILSKPSNCMNGITIRLGVNSAHLGCIAKLRAARILWNAKAKQAHDSTLQIHAETSLTELSHTDTWTNIIRHSAAAAAAIMGNCDGLLIHPHDARIARTNPFGNRIARNIFNTLIFESKLNAFADPLAGSFAIEAMTSELVERSWQLHEQIESSGGLLSNLDLTNTKAIVPHLIQTQRAALIAEESHRRPGLLGVSEYPNLAEVADLKNHENPGAFITYSAKPQLAENWNEELRLSDIFGTLKNAGITANIDYVTILIDEPSATAARLAWTENALSAAGMRDSQGKAPPSNVIHVIIGKDSTYKEKLLATLDELRDQGRCFVVAGRLPSELETAAIACGLTATLYAGCNLEKTLRHVLLQAGAKL